MGNLLKFLKFYVESITKICNKVNVILVQIQDNWEFKFVELIESNGYFQHILKLISQIFWRLNIPNIETVF